MVFYNCAKARLQTTATLNINRKMFSRKPRCKLYLGLLFFARPAFGFVILRTTRYADGNTLLAIFSLFNIGGDKVPVNTVKLVRK